VDNFGVIYVGFVRFVDVFIEICILVFDVFGYDFYEWLG